MPTIQIKHVPEDVHATLTRRAAQSDQSLQEYMLSWLIADARRLTVDEVLDRVESRGAGTASFADVAELLREDRDSR